MAEIFETLDHMGTPLKKNKISKIGLRHVLSWPKLGVETNVMTLGLLVASENMDTQTHRQDFFMYVL